MATPNDLANHRKKRERRVTRAGKTVRVAGVSTFTNDETGETFTGADVLDDLTAFYSHYMALPNKHCAPTMALWNTHTYMTEHADVTPRLVYQSPEPGSGKTRGLELLEVTARKPKLTMNTSVAALYRRIEQSGDQPITVLQDEFDAVWSRNAGPGAEDLRALFNSGYRRGATVDRCEGDAARMKVREFRVYAPVAMAGLTGRLPGTLETRSIIIDMQRRAPNERIGDFRPRQARAEIQAVVSNVEVWMQQVGPDFSTSLPTMPDGVTDRAAELWEVLLFIADQAGGRWPEVARAACEHFVLNRTKDSPSIGIRLLADIRKVFTAEKVDKMPTARLLDRLHKLDESEWKNFFGKELSDLDLSRKLKPYGATPHQLWITDIGKTRGYSIDGTGGLGPAWERYLTAPESADLEVPA
jgi:hypothetical protein